MGTPGVMPPFTIGLGTPALANAYGGGIPSLGAFALAQTGALGSAATPGALRGLSNVLLVSNLNEEVMNPFFYDYIYAAAENIQTTSTTNKSSLPF